MSEIQYHEAAEAEVFREVVYLQQRGSGLGTRLLAEIRNAERRIAAFPQVGEEIRPGIRKCVLPTFRYSIIYSLESQGPLVLALAHHSRRPGYWFSRATKRSRPN